MGISVAMPCNNGYGLPLVNDGGAGRTRGSRQGCGGRSTWDALALRLYSTALGFLGCALALLSTLDYFGPTKAHGQLLGLGSALLAVAAWAVSAPGALARWIPGLSGPRLAFGVGGGNGQQKSSPPLLSLRAAVLIGLAWAALSTGSLMSAVLHDIDLHCSLSETLVRISHLEQRASDAKTADMMTSVFFRLNELDDMLDLVQSGAVGEGELREQVASAKSTDQARIAKAVSRLTRHAEKMAVGLRDRAAEGRATISRLEAEAQLQPPENQVTGQPMALAQQQEALSLLQRRIEAVDQIVHYIDSKHHEGDGALSFEEYEIILSALIEAGAAGMGGRASGADVVDVHTLKREQSNLASLKESYERHTSSSYQHVVKGSPHERALVAMAKRREAARVHFEGHFMGVMDSQGPMLSRSFNATLTGALEDLPDHCMRELQGYSAFGWLSWGLLASALLAAHAVLVSGLQAVAAGKDE
ncbi:hypothetical protein FOA52_004086 [Chlamydomonas sp. UWO 241]|nr:hypothetical protein FOA52_004086 [Chlamydomonas sp. UWO 241]